MPTPHHLLLIIAMLITPVAFAQDITVVINDFGCNICAAGYGRSLSEINQDTKRKLTIVVGSAEYYNPEQTEESLKQRLSITTRFNVVISDSLVTALMKMAPVKYNKNMGGYVYIHSGNRYDYFSTVADLAKKGDLLNLVEQYQISSERTYENLHKEARKAFYACPVCTHAVYDSTLYVLSVYGGFLSRFEGPEATEAEVFRFREPPLFPWLYASLAGDTAGWMQYLESATFNPIIPIGLQLPGPDDVRIAATFYAVIRDSTGARMGGAQEVIIHLRPSDKSAKVYPINMQGVPAPMQIAGWISLNDSQMVFSFSDLKANPRSGEPLFGLFQYHKNEIVFKGELRDFVMPKVKEDMGFIGYHRNRYALLPVTGKVINCRDLKDTYQLDHKKITAFIKKSFHTDIVPKKAWWMDYASTDPRLCRVIFSYDDRLYVLFIDKSTSEPITGQVFRDPSLADRTSATKMYGSSIYFITKAGTVSRITLD
jgi:hypothetical protein